MSAFKEIIIQSSTEAEPFFSSNDRQSKSFSSVLNLDKTILYFIANKSNIKIQSFTTTTLNEESKTLNKTINVKGNIIENIFAVKANENKAFLFVFQNLPYILIYPIDLQRMDLLEPCTINLTESYLNYFTYVEFIEDSSNGYSFALGCKDGTIEIRHIIESNGNFQIFNDFSWNSSKKGIFNFFSGNQNKVTENPSVSSIKFMKNNLIAYLKENCVFEIFDLISRKVIYSTNLINNSKYGGKERLKNSKIVFNVHDFDLSQINVMRQKSFDVIIFLNFESGSELSMFEIWFQNIQTEMNSNYDNMHLGSDYVIKNPRTFVYNTKILDILLSQNNLWMVIESDSPEIPYELKCFTLDSFKERNSSLDKLFFEDQSNVEILEKRIHNLLFILNQINMNYQISLSNKNKLLFSVLISGEEYFSKELLIDFCTKTFGEKFLNKNQCLNFLKSKYLDEKTTSQLQEEFIIPLINKIKDSDRILSLGIFENDDLGSIVIFRNKSLSILKKLESFNRIEQIIFEEEYNLRKIIFKSNSYDERESQLNFYISNEINSNKRNSLFIILALLRIYMTEAFLNLNNEKYLSGFFNHENNSNILGINQTDHFIQTVLSDKLMSQFSSISLEFIHRNIMNIFINNKKIIYSSIQALIKEGNRITGTDSEINNEINAMENEGNNLSQINSGYKLINGIYCDMLCQIVSIFLKSNFYLWRDIFTLFLWYHNYLEDSEEDFFDFSNESEIFEIDTEQMETISRMNFFNNFRCFLSGNHLTFFSHDNVSKIEKNSLLSQRYKDKQVTYLENFIFDNFSKLERKRLISNKDIHFLFYKYQNEILNLNGNSTMILFKWIIENNDDELLSLLNILKDTKSDLLSLYVEILVSQKTKRIKKGSELLTEYYSKLLSDQNISLISILEFCKKLGVPGINEIERIPSNLIKGYLLMERILQKYIKLSDLSQFYFRSFGMIYEHLMKNSNTQEDLDKSIAKSFIEKIFESALKIDFDLGLNLLSFIIDESKQNRKCFLIHNAMTKIVERIITSLIENSPSLTVNVTDKDFLQKLSKLIAFNKEFLGIIIENLEIKCKQNLKLETFLGNNRGRDMQNFNYFILLRNIYYLTKDKKGISLISYKYSNEIEDLIRKNERNMNLKLISLLLTEENNALSDCLGGLKSNTFGNIPLKEKEINYKKTMVEIKQVLIEFYLSKQNDMQLEDNNPNGKITEADIIHAMSDEGELFDLLFKCKLYQIIIVKNLILYIREEYAYNLMTNIIKQLYIKKGVWLNNFIDSIITNEEKKIKLGFDLLEILLIYKVNSKINQIVSVLSKISLFRTILILNKFDELSLIYDTLNALNNSGEGNRKIIKGDLSKLLLNSVLINARKCNIASMVEAKQRLISLIEGWIQLGIIDP